MPPQTPENQLIQEALNGNESAFIELYRSHVDQLYGFVYSKLNNVEEAEDITSETFLQALKSLKNYSGKSSFKNWLYGIAKYLILAQYRDRYKHKTLELDDNFAHTHSTLENDEPNSELSRLAAANILAALPENYRQVLELRFLKGYTVIETAKALGISEENAKVLQHRAIKKAQTIALDLPRANFDI
mgnify:CR=1 FL=1